MGFEDFLISKKIDSPAFKQHQPDVWEQWKQEFDQLHPSSFTAQKLFLINNLRRKYLLKESSEVVQTVSAAPVAHPKPVMKPKIN